MVKYCSRSLVARKLSDEWIISLAGSFPQIAWNRSCLRTLLDLVNTVGKACNQVMVVRIGSLDNSNPCSGNRHLAWQPLSVGTAWWAAGQAKSPARSRTAGNPLYKIWNDSCTRTNLLHASGLYTCRFYSSEKEYMNQFRNACLGFLNHIGFSLGVEISSLRYGIPGCSW